MARAPEFEEKLYHLENELMCLIVSLHMHGSAAYERRVCHDLCRLPFTLCVMAMHPPGVKCRKRRNLASFIMDQPDRLLE
eukprot:9145795-Pyramimonas_sp.AAC.1